MQPPIKIQTEGRHINVYFSYNTDIIEIMREHHGRWKRNDKCWTFPLTLKSKLIDTLQQKKYRVQIVSSKEAQKKQVVDSTHYFDDKDVILVWGLCKKCNQKKLIGQDCMCVKCSVEK